MSDGDESTLIGRRSELAILQRALESARQGRGAVSVLSGEAGLGKSALAGEVSASAHRLGFEVLSGRAWEFADAPPLFPLGNAFRALGVENAEQDGDVSRFSLWERVLLALAGRASSRPICILLEDLHAADLQTLDLLVYLSLPVQSLAVLILVTARLDDPRLGDRASRRLTRLAKDGIDLRLVPLSAPEISDLARVHARRELSGNVLAKLTTLTGGNPFFVIECARRVAESGATAADIAGLPTTVKRVVSERIELLPEATRRVLAAAAIFGREFSARDVALVQGILAAKVVDELLPALSARLVEEIEPGRFCFRHVLVRDVLEDALPPRERADLHQRAEAALARLGEGADVALERARHALEGLTEPDDGHALGLLQRSLSLLETSAAFDRAHALCQRADALRRSGLLPPASAEQRLHAASLALRAGQYAECRRLADELISEARAARDPSLLGRAVLTLGGELHAGVVVPALVDRLNEAISALGDRDEVLGCRLGARLAAALQPHEDPMLPVEMARSVIERARRLHDPALLCEVLFTAGSALVDFAPIEERVALWHELYALSEQNNDPVRSSRARARLAIDAVVSGNFQLFEREVESVLASSLLLGHPAIRCRALLLSSMRALAVGRFAESERHIVEVEQLAPLVDEPSISLSLALHRCFRARLMHLDEEYTRATASLDTTLRVSGAGEGFRQLLRAAHAARLEDPDGVRAALLGVASTHFDLAQDPSFWPLLAESYLCAGDRAAAARLRERMAATTEREVSGSHVVVTYEGPVLRLMALLDAVLGRVDEAESALRICLALAEQRGHRPWVAQISHDLAGVLERAGRSEAARPHFVDAASLADELGMTGLARRARRQLTTEPSGNDAADVQAPTALSLVSSQEDDGWWVVRGRTRVFVRDTRGMQLLARLVERPDEEIHVLTLASDGGAALGESDAGDQLDDAARSAYKARLDALTEQLSDAEERQDLGRLASLGRERELLAAELSRAVGLGGRARKAGSHAERARVNVQRRLKDAIARLREADPSLGAYVERAVRTGTFCCYRP